MPYRVSLPIKSIDRGRVVVSAGQRVRLTSSRGASKAATSGKSVNRRMLSIGGPCQWDSGGSSRITRLMRSSSAAAYMTERSH